jgi:hypothetical protein
MSNLEGLIGPKYKQWFFSTSNSFAGISKLHKLAITDKNIVILAKRKSALKTSLEDDDLSLII